MTDSYHQHQGNLGVGMQRCLSQRQPTPHPPTQVATPRYLFQVLSVHPPGLLSWLAGRDASSNCWDTFVTGNFKVSLLLIIFVMCQKYEKAAGLSTCSPHRWCLHHWHPETGGISLRAQWKLLVTFWKIFERSRAPMWPLACYPLTHSSTPPSLGMYLPTAGISQLFYIPKYLHFPYVLFFLSVLWDFQSWSLFGTIYSISLRIFLTTVLSSVYCI